MKTLKYLTICFIVCCLFSGNLFAQAPATVCELRGVEGCTVGLSVEINGLIVGTAPGTDPARIGSEADVVFVGDTLAYSVSISLPGTNSCPTDFILADVIFPDGTPFPLNGGNQIDLCVPGAGPGPDPGVDPNSSEYVETNIGPYVVRAVDIGSFLCSAEPIPAGAVRACVDGDGVSRRATRDDVADVAAEYTTSVVDPCVEVVKTPWCVRDGVIIEEGAVSKVGDEIVWQFEIENCGTDPLEFVEIIDALLDPVSVPESCGTLALPLLPGETCSFLSDPYLVEAPGTVINEVEVIFNVLVPSAFGGFERVVISEPGQAEEFLTVDDGDSSEVPLVDPSFTVAAECIGIQDNEAGFNVTFDNTGDVDLIVTPADTFAGQIPSPFTLLAGTQQIFFVILPLEVVCGEGTATITVDASATLPEELCLLNVIQPTGGPATATCAEETEPCFTAEKVCDMDGPILPGDTVADFDIIVENCGDVDLNIFITDPAAIVPPASPILVPAGQTITVDIEVAVDPDICLGAAREVLNTANVLAECLDGTVVGDTDVQASCVVECPDFEVIKDCNEPARLYEDGEIALYDIVITNTGDVDLDLLITDLNAVPQIIDQPGFVAAGETYSMTVEIPVECSDQDPTDGTPILIPNTVSVIAIDPAGNEYGPETADADCAYICEPVGEEGCTPGFWKNHKDCWCDAYPPEMAVADVWTALQDPNYVALDDNKWDPATDTLDDSVRYRGGGGLAGAARNMLRHATAALQNACVGDVAYPASVATIISEGNRALATEDPAEIQALHWVLADWNENSPCPINAHCEVTDDDDYVDPR